MLGIMTDMLTRTTAEGASAPATAGPNGYFRFLLYGGISFFVAGALFLGGVLQVRRVNHWTDLDGRDVLDPASAAGISPLVAIAVVCFVFAFFMLLSVAAIKAAKN